MDILPSFYFLKERMFFYAHISVHSNKIPDSGKHAPVSMVSSLGLRQLFENLFGQELM